MMDLTALELSASFWEKYRREPEFSSVQRLILDALGQLNAENKPVRLMQIWKLVKKSKVTAPVVFMTAIDDLVTQGFFCRHTVRRREYLAVAKNFNSMLKSRSQPVLPEVDPEQLVADHWQALAFDHLDRLPERHLKKGFQEIEKKHGHLVSPARILEIGLEIRVLRRTPVFRDLRDRELAKAARKFG